ncbi:MAG TPA: HDIG domain-containing protein [Bacteroidales bacterium]|nr:HDIG domain-containing protein [Bacteroidales bacterium]
MKRYGISRDEALALMHSYITNERTRWHCLASEAVMRRVAMHFGEDEEKWGLAGLLHDLDMEVTDGDIHIHGLETRRILNEAGVHPEIVETACMHNEVASGLERSTRFQHALAASETITGLISATALVYPDKKLSSVKSSSVVKRMKEEKFAASVKRERIMECELIGIPLPEFAAMAIEAMLPIAEEIGL